MYLKQMMPQVRIKKPIFQSTDFCNTGVIANLPERRFLYKSQKSSFNILHKKVMKNINQNFKSPYLDKIKHLLNFVLVSKYNFSMFDILPSSIQNSDTT